MAEEGLFASSAPSIRSAIAPRRAISACAVQGTFLSTALAEQKRATLNSAGNINEQINRFIKASSRIGKQTLVVLVSKVRGQGQTRNPVDSKGLTSDF